MDVSKPLLSDLRMSVARLVGAERMQAHGNECKPYCGRTSFAKATEVKRAEGLGDPWTSEASANALTRVQAHLADHCFSLSKAASKATLLPSKSRLRTKLAASEAP